MFRDASHCFTRCSEVEEQCIESLNMMGEEEFFGNFYLLANHSVLPAGILMGTPDKVRD